jgi:hypothetical protein
MLAVCSRAVATRNGAGHAGVESETNLNPDVEFAHDSAIDDRAALRQ